MANPAKNGFSLIEIVMTLFIVGAMLILYSGINKIMPMNEGVEHQEMALRAARSQIETMRMMTFSSLKGLPASGTFAVPQLSTFGGAGTFSHSVYSSIASLESVTVTVTWKESAFAISRSVTLSTLMSAAGL